MNEIQDGGQDLTVSEYARRFGIPVNTVHKQIARKRILAYKRAGQWYIPADELTGPVRESVQDSIDPAYVKHLEEEITWLRQRLADKEEEARFRDVIMARFLPPTTEPVELPPPSMPRQWWRRLINLSR